MANSVAPDQTSPSGAVWSGSVLCAFAILLETLVYEIVGHLPYQTFRRLDHQMRISGLFLFFTEDKIWLDILFILSPKSFFFFSHKNKSEIYFKCSQWVKEDEAFIFEISLMCWRFIKHKDVINYFVLNTAIKRISSFIDKFWFPPQKFELCSKKSKFWRGVTNYEKPYVMIFWHGISYNYTRNVHSSVCACVCVCVCVCACVRACVSVCVLCVFQLSRAVKRFSSRYMT